MKAAALLVALALPWQLQAAEPPPLRFIAPLNHALPFADFKDGELSTGIVKDISEAVAARIGQRAEFVSVPPRRVAQVLTAGGADGVCYIGRGWIDGEFHWSPPVFEQVAVLATRADVPPPANLQALAGEPIGTVYGYRYTPLEPVLGSDFVRDDAPTMLINLRKLAAKRTRYAMTEQITLDFHIKRHPQDGLKVAMPMGQFPTYCVFTLAHALPLEKLDRAVRELVREGGVEKILARYR